MFAEREKITQCIDCGEEKLCVMVGLDKGVPTYMCKECLDKTLTESFEAFQNMSVIDGVDNVTLRGLCNECVKKPNVRGLKQIRCLSCNEEKLVEADNLSNKCGYCSKEQGICLKCGKKL